MTDTQSANNRARRLFCYPPYHPSTPQTLISPGRWVKMDRTMRRLSSWDDRVLTLWVALALPREHLRSSALTCVYDLAHLPQKPNPSRFRTPLTVPSIAAVAVRRARRRPPF